ncbi:hypothetical protein [Paenibacillus macquariensis]|uniref:Uncharacterized protein n=1 Tax=Paenibacillus macquariensis TaxID=948756 RepID=A0ABY1KET5_9BACL|nr:hypothetical protein [Paenibacillus macquariensis]MEC0092476.1 hypothetical protein [Paenibacillus macquariensis]OAB35434.1 hypothetical protein PMSM_09260 [Paenibacillus macquariensis subsp. macquariensis]SIR72652.1 hypothetical protein SAMN05421578_1489 [Paenibacillus macquariensis]
MKQSTPQQRTIRDQLNELYRQKPDNPSGSIKLQNKINRLQERLKLIDQREISNSRHKKRPRVEA